jgi:hypothetical protein
VFTTPSGVPANGSIILTLPQEFEVSFPFSFTDVDLNVGGPYIASATLAAASSGATWGVSRTSSTTITLNNGSAAIGAASTVYIRLGTNALFQSTGVNQIKNATTTGNKLIVLAGAFGFADVGTTTVNIIPEDTVTLSALVPQSLTFTISATTTYFGNLGVGAAKFASSTNSAGDTVETIAHTLAVSTNAPFGYTITLVGSTLTSLQNPSNTIPTIGTSAASSSAGTSQFGIRATASGGTGSSVATPYSFTTSYAFTPPSATTSAILATGSGSTNTTTYSLRYVANVSGIQEAGYYATGITYVATANF